MQEDQQSHFGNRDRRAECGESSPARFGKGVTKKGHETIMVPRRYPNSFGGVGFVLLGQLRPGLLPDLRERVLRAIDQGKAQKEVVDLFGVSLSTVKRYLKQRSQLGHVQPKKIPGRPPTKRAKLQESLLTQLEAYPDATFQEHCDIWEKESGIRVSIMTMSRAIDPLGWTRKKNVRREREKRRRANVMERKREKA